MAKIAITGATGYVARNLRRLLARNHIRTVCIARRDFAAAGSEQKIVTSDYDLPVLRGCSCLVHLAGSGYPSQDSSMESANAGLAGRVISACKRSGIGRIIFTSGLGVSPRPTTSYFASKYRAEQEIISSGLEYVIFRPSYIVGRADPLSRNIQKQLRRGQVVIPGSGRYMLQPVMIDDAVSVLHQATYTPRYAGRTLDLVGPKTISFARFVRLYAPDSKIRRVPLERVMQQAVFGRGSPYMPDDLAILVGGFTGDHDRLARLSGIDFKGPDSLKSGSLS